MNAATVTVIRCSECRREPVDDEDAMRHWRTQAAKKVLHILCPECWIDHGR